MIDDYLNMIQVDRVRTPSLAFLDTLQKRHIESLGWDSLDLFLGREISLDSREIIWKFRKEKRGGICYELNGAFCWLLRQLGFDCYLASARVYGHQEKILDFSVDTHVAIVVSISGGPYLVDVGWGDSYRKPVPLRDALHFADHSGCYRIRFEKNRAQWIVEQRLPDEWRAQYGFSMKERELLDFHENLNNLYFSPELWTYRKLNCISPTDAGCIWLKENQFVVRERCATRTVDVSSVVEISNILRREFNMEDAFIDFCIEKMAQ